MRQSDNIVIETNPPAIIPESKSKNSSEAITSPRRDDAGVAKEKVTFVDIGFMSFQQMNNINSPSIGHKSSVDEDDDTHPKSLSNESENFNNSKDKSSEGSKSEQTETNNRTLNPPTKPSPIQNEKSKSPKSKKGGKAPALKVMKKYLGKPTHSPMTTKKKAEKQPKTKRAVQQSFKKGLLTIKNNLKYLQPKNGLSADYLLIIKNNSQTIEKHGSSTSATKYITLTEGDLKAKFFSKEGVAYNPTDFFLMKKDETMEEDKPLTHKMTKKVLDTDTETESDAKQASRKRSKICKNIQINEELQIVSSLDSEQRHISKLPKNKERHFKKNNINAKQNVDVHKSSTDSENKSHNKTKRPKVNNEKRKKKKLQDEVSISESNESLNLFNMKRVAKKLKTPGEHLIESNSESSTEQLEPDHEIYSYGAGAGQTLSDIIKKQRELLKKKRKEAIQKETIDILGPSTSNHVNPNFTKNNGKGAKGKKTGKVKRGLFIN